MPSRGELLTNLKKSSAAAINNYVTTWKKILVLRLLQIIRGRVKLVLNGALKFKRSQLLPNKFALLICFKILNINSQSHHATKLKCIHRTEVVTLRILQIFISVTIK